MLYRCVIATVVVAFAGLAWSPALALSQEAPRAGGRDTARAELDQERQARLARRGGGVRVGTWDVRGLATVAGATASRTPALEGYVRRGLDLHLALEHSVGFWRRTQTATQTSSGPLGTTQTTSTLETYVIPQLTSVSFFPVTRPAQRVEPYVKAGAGFAIGVDDRTGDGGVLFSSEGMSLVPGFGLSGSTGLEVRLTNALGLAAAARYQWIRFFQDLASQRTFEGFGAEVGVTYRFQFR